MFYQSKLKRFSWLERPFLTLSLFALIILFIRIFLRGPLLELDEAEQFVMAQNLSLGYPNQPPLYSWLQYCIFQILGCNLESLALLKSLLIFAFLYYFHQICRLHCQTIELAWCATISLALVPAISFDLIKDNTHSVLALLSACLTWYWFVSPSKFSQTGWYIVWGFIIGLGLLSKFNYLLFLAILLISGLTLTQYRSKILNPKIVLTLLMSFIVASPYGYWLLQHHHLGFRSVYKLAPEDMLFWTGFMELIFAVLVFTLPNLLIANLFFPLKSQQKVQKTLESNHLLNRYLMVCLPFLCLCFLLMRMKNFETRWLIPVLFLCPLFYFSRINASKDFGKKVKLYLSLCLVIQAAFFLILIGRGHSNHKINNYTSISQIVWQIKNQSEHVDYFVSDSHWLLGNLMLHFRSVRGWLLHPVNQPTLPQGKSLLIWQNTTKPFWVEYFSITQPLGAVKTMEDPKNHQVLAGYTFVGVGS